MCHCEPAAFWRVRQSMLTRSHRLLRRLRASRNDTHITVTLKNNIAFLKKIESRLKSAGVLSPRAEAEALILHFGRLTRLDFFTGEKEISVSVRRMIQKVLRVRQTGKPLAYLTNEAPFYGYTFQVTKDTLIPRPETELLVEEATRVLDKFYSGQNPEILDVGTGSGCIAISLTLQRPACRMTAFDASLKALEVARKNVKLFGLNDKIQLAHSRLFNSFGKNKRAFWDIVVSNPPYVPSEDLPKLSREVRSEPRLALDGGAKGVETIERLLKQAPFYIKKDGWLLMEIGDGQAAILSEKMKRNRSFKNFRFVKDLNGIDRIMVAQCHCEPAAFGGRGNLRFCHPRNL